MKQINKLTIPLLILAFILSACNSTGTKTKNSNSDSKKQNTDGWELLFNGITTAGWHTYGKDSAGKAWKAEDSALHLDASVKSEWQTKGGGDIVTDNEYENFELELEWKISEGGNSGIMFYVKEDTSKYPYPWSTGPEIQVCDNEKNEDGKVDKARAGDLYDLAASSSRQFVKPAMQWNRVKIIAEKGKLDCYMNDHHVLSATLWDDAWKKSIAGTKFKTMPGFGTFKKGRIALQDHGADVWYRNIKIKKL